MSAQHTPIPWVAERRYIFAASQPYLATCHSGINSVSNEEADANAAFAVRAVNSRADLLAALKAAREYFAALDAMQPDRDRGSVGRAVRETVRAAILKAEGAPDSVQSNHNKLAALAEDLK